MATRRTKQKKTGNRIAELGDVEEFATTIKPTWVECRSDGHDMRKFDVQLTEHNTYIRTRKCRRCTYKRHQVVDREGRILNTTPEYPDGYLMPKGTGRLDSEGRAVFRAAVIEAEYEQSVRRRS